MISGISYFLQAKEPSWKANNVEELIELLKSRNRTVASCESFTGGLFAALLTEVPEHPLYSKDPLSVTSMKLKFESSMLMSELIDTYGAVSEETASAMAKNTRLLMKSD